MEGIDTLNELLVDVLLLACNVYSYVHTRFDEAKVQAEEDDEATSPTDIDLNEVSTLIAKI